MAPFKALVAVFLVGALGCGDTTAEVPDAGYQPPPRPTEPITISEGMPCRPDAPPPGVFTDASELLAIDFVQSPYPPPDPEEPGGWVLEDFAGVAIADLDYDGALDLVFTNGGGPYRVYLTAGRGPGNYRGQDLHTSEQDPTRVTTVGDLNGDGNRDLVLVTRLEPTWLAGDGKGGLGVETPMIPPREVEVSIFSVALGDINGDGWLDAYLGNQQDFSDPDDPYTPGREVLLLNDGTGGFTDASAAIPKRKIDDLTFIASLIDLDNDGDLDVYEVNDARPLDQLGIGEGEPDNDEAEGNRLYRNDGVDGDGRPILEDVTEGSGADTLIAGMGLAVGDYDNDGLVDLYVTAMLPDKNALLRNLGDLKFEDVTAERGAHTLVAAHDVGWGAVFFDADADGLLDLLVTHGFIEVADRQLRKNVDEQTNVLLRNDGDNGFEDVTTAANIEGPAWSRSPVVGDINRDGFPDLVVGNVDAAPYIQLNGCDDTPWLTVRLDGPAPNGDGIGARITATVGDVTQTRLIMAGGDGLYGNSAPEAYFAFPVGTDSVDVTVHWPGGRTSEWPDLPMRRMVTIRE